MNDTPTPPDSLPLGLGEEEIAKLDARYQKLASSPLGMKLPWERKASAGKPLLYGGNRGLLAYGTIATWDEFDFIADIVNAWPKIREALSLRSTVAQGAGAQSPDARDSARMVERLRETAQCLDGRYGCEENVQTAQAAADMLEALSATPSHTAGAGDANLVEKLRKFGSAHDKHDDGCTIVPQKMLLDAAAALSRPASERERPTVDDTLALIQRLHAGQTDKAGDEYWRHPVRVMSRIPDITWHERHVALLHDVLEDTATKARDLLDLGYSFDILLDVMSLTRPKSCASYPMWIDTIKTFGSPSAIRVKIADIEDNLDESRLSKLSSDEQTRLRSKYEPAIRSLKASTPRGEK